MVDPVRAAGKEIAFEGTVPPSHLARLQEMLVEPCQEVDALLSFRMDEQGIPALHGEANTGVKVICQRCHEPMDLSLKVAFDYAALLKGQSLDELPSHYDTVTPNEFGEIDLHQLIEDELILGMPIVAMHEASDCKINPHAMVFGELPEEAQQTNPFAVLKKLKK